MTYSLATPIRLLVALSLVATIAVIGVASSPAQGESLCYSDILPKANDAKKSFARNCGYAKWVDRPSQRCDWVTDRGDSGFRCEGPRSGGGTDPADEKEVIENLIDRALLERLLERELLEHIIELSNGNANIDEKEIIQNLISTQRIENLLEQELLDHITELANGTVDEKEIIQNLVSTQVIENLIEQAILDHIIEQGNGIGSVVPAGSCYGDLFRNPNDAKASYARACSDGEWTGDSSVRCDWFTVGNRQGYVCYGPR